MYWTEGAKGSDWSDVMFPYELRKWFKMCITQNWIFPVKRGIFRAGIRLNFPVYDLLGLIRTRNFIFSVVRKKWACVGSKNQKSKTVKNRSIQSLSIQCGQLLVCKSNIASTGGTSTPWIANMRSVTTLPNYSGVETSDDGNDSIEFFVIGMVPALQASFRNKKSDARVRTV